MALSLNKQKEKDWNSLIKQEAKTYGWKFKSFFTYKTAKDFFYEVTFYTSGYSNSITGSLAFKPLIVDEVFWNLADMPDNSKMPLSFRGNGAFVLTPKDVFEYELNVVPNNLKAEIDSLFERVNMEVEKLQSTITDINAFVSFVKQHPDKRSEWFDLDMLILSHMVNKNFDEALSLLNYAKKNRGICSWSFGDKDFYDLAIEYSQGSKG